MGNGKKGSSYKPRSFECKGYVEENGKRRNDSSANIFESMLLSDAFRELPTRAKALYMYCKAQYYGHRKPRADYPDIPYMQADECFYLSFPEMGKYGLYSKTSKAEYYEDMKTLEAHGFIKRISKGHPGKKSIYKLTGDWQTWEKQPESEKGKG